MNYDNFSELAAESIHVLEEIAQTAKVKLGVANSVGLDSFATGNTLTSDKPFQNLANIQNVERSVLQSLCSEPAIMRVVLEDDEQNQKVIYIARTTSIALPSKKKFASYRSPVGRIAELPSGESILLTLDDGNREYWIVEKTDYHPVVTADGWDSLRTLHRPDSKSSFSIDSLRDLLQALSLDSADELDRLIEQSEVHRGIVAGISHQVRTAIGLRDQPVLDQFQGKIFRLPIDSRLLILGPPGTGKTTTLIKRLGQKLDVTNLDEEERQLVEAKSEKFSHSSSWLMFTPSELLKHYLKEAFSREQVPASDAHIRTWVSFRNDIARNNLSILRSANSGRFSLKNDINFLSDDVSNDPTQWFAAFQQFHEDRLRKQLVDGLSILTEAVTEDEQQIRDWLTAAYVMVKESPLIEVYRRLESSEGMLKNAYSATKEVTDNLIKKARNILFNKNNDIFSQLAAYLDSIQQDNEPDEDELFDDDEQDEVQPPSQADIKIAVKAFEIAIKALARTKYLKRSLSKTSRSGLVVGFLSEQLPNNEVLIDIGRHMSLQNGLRRFINSHKRYVLDISKSYQDFRKDKPLSMQFFQKEPSIPTQLSPMELDGLVLMMLQNARSLMQQPFVVRSKTDSKFNYLINIEELFRNQIMVDEATDFSMLELACMANLTALQFQSFFACGDFNQRITQTGIKQREQLLWALPSIDIQTVKTVYRQSRKLNRFAEALLHLQGGDVTALGQVAEESTHDGVNPVLCEFADEDCAALWISKRIKEVERLVQQLPTIAVLVNSESEVKPMAEKLNQYLEEINLSAVACEEGRALGDGAEVRVFDIKHIKGLEFEAVFFAGVDKLIEEKPELFDRYLYVGATRAATYLGLVCEQSLPTQLVSLRSHFDSKWL